jgi:hypothetical protein
MFLLPNHSKPEFKTMQSTACKARKWPATKAADDVPSHVLK